MQLVLLNNVPIFEQLALEEAILRSGKGDWCLLNTGSPPAVVMGISGKPQELVDERCKLPLIRRFSGGGCVVIDEETVFLTLIGDMDAPNPCKIHTHVESKLKMALPSLPFALRENDYILGNHKFGGNAQYITKNRYLHHASLLWDWDPEKMAFLKHPKKQPKYRLERTHESFLTSLKEHFSSKEMLINQLLSYFSNHPDPRVPSTEELANLLNGTHRKALQLITAQTV